MTTEQCAMLIKRLLGAFPTQRQKMSAEDVTWMTISYQSGLLDLDYELASKAVDRANKTAEWIPTIARIRAEAAELEIGAPRSGMDAWGDVIACVRRVGVSGQPTFADAIVRTVVQQVGWRAICMAGETDGTVRARFCDAYEHLERHTRKEIQVSNGISAASRALTSGNSIPHERDGKLLPISQLASRALPAKGHDQ